MKVSLLVLFFVGLASMAASAEVVELKFKKEVMLRAAVAANGKLEMVLPEFDIFKPSGVGIFHLISLPNDFISLLSTTLKHSKENARLLNDSLKDVTTADGQEYKIEKLSPYNFVFVEYWAEWCVPCKQQAKLVKEYLAEHSELNVLWLKVERDPTQLND